MLNKNDPLWIGYSAIKDYVLRRTYLGKDTFTLRFIEEFNNILSLFSKRSCAKIIYVLYMVKYSNQYELEVYSDIHNYSIFNFVRKMKNLKIVKQLPKSSKEHKTCSHFWKKNRPKSSSDNTFYYLDKEFIPVIESFLPLLECIFDNAVIEDLKTRRDNCQKYFDAIERQKKTHIEQIKESRGTCHHCETLIPKNAVEDKDFRYLNKTWNRMLCMRCDKKVPFEQKLEWSRKK